MVGYKQRKYYAQPKTGGANQRRSGTNRGGPGGGINTRGGRSYRRGDYSGNSRYGMRGAGGYSGSTHNQGRRGGGMSSGSQMLNPWESGVVPTAGAGSGNYGNFMPYVGGHTGSLSGMGGGGSTELMGSISHLGHMGNSESKLALNILNAVLSSGTSVDEGRGRRYDAPPANKMRRLDWAGGYDSHQGHTVSSSLRQPIRKFPRREQKFSPRRTSDKQLPRRGKGGPSAPDQQTRNLNPKRKVVNNQGLAKNQKKSETAQAATGTSGQKVDKPDPKQKSETKNAEKEAVEEDDDGKSSEEKENKDEQNVSKSLDAGGDSENIKEEKESPKKDKSKYSAPTEALKCHVCNFTQFNSAKGFRNHLESTNHEKMEQAFHTKGAAILHFLRSQSKLAAQRDIVKSKKMGSTGRITMCSKCQCPIRGGLTAHRKTREHFLVSNYTKCVPCQMKFDTRVDLEKHRLTYPHLKMQLMIEQQRLEKAEKFKKMQEERKKTEDMQIPELESLKNTHDAVEELKITYNHTKVWKKNYVPIFDPAVPIGLNFIQKKIQFCCKVCPKIIVHTAKEAHSHFCSPRHHENYAAYLQRLEKNKKVETVKEEEIKQEDDTEENDKEQETFQVKEESEVKQSNGEFDEDISFEDMKNMEVVDEALDEGSMDTSADTSKITVKEEDVADNENMDTGADDSKGENKMEEPNNEGEGNELGEVSVVLEEVGEDLNDNEDEKKANGTDSKDEVAIVEDCEEDMKPVVPEKIEDKDKPKRAAPVRQSRRGRGQGRTRVTKD